MKTTSRWNTCLLIGVAGSREARSDGVKVSTAGSATGTRGMYIVQYMCTTAHAFAIDDRTFPTSEEDVGRRAAAGTR